ncbi:hypothetical protein DFJ74DRAFT_640796 [Hyaloraphidium curvatum]|nr:hypothetical protein DFJ74DRAFT_640796 [Hyaloraphidium curvatum]
MALDSRPDDPATSDDGEEEFYSADEHENVDVPPRPGPVPGVGFDRNAFYRKFDHLPPTTFPSGVEETFAKIFDDVNPGGRSTPPDMIATRLDRPEVPKAPPAPARAKAPAEESDAEGSVRIVESEDDEASDAGVGGAGEEEDETIESIVSPAEMERLLEESRSFKGEGNDLFGRGLFQEAIHSYDEALRVCPDTFKEERAIYFSNKAACYVKLSDWQKAVLNCSRALEEKPDYVKALQRRAFANEKLDTSTALSEALEDYKKLVALEPLNKEARNAVLTLPARIRAKADNEKDEMIGKLKELGNSILGRFGLSTDNFQMVQDPATGSYSVKFNN